MSPKVTLCIPHPGHEYDRWLGATHTVRLRSHYAGRMAVRLCRPPGIHVQWVAPG